MINLSSFVQFHALQAPDRHALAFQNELISYGEFYERITRTGGWLARLTIGRGDVVAVLMKNSAAFLEIAFATSQIGAVFLPINFRLSADEIAYIAGNSEAKLLIVDEEFVASTTGAQCEVVPVDAAAQANSLRLVGDASPAAMTQVQPNDMFRLMFTSATTYRPKGVIHSHSNFYWKCMDHVMALQLNAGTRLYVGGPLYHVGAFDLPGVATLWMGGMLDIHREFEAGKALQAIQNKQINDAWLAPVVTTALLSHPERDKFDVTSLRWVIGGGERTPESRIEEFSKYFTNARYIDAYGLTESCSGDTLIEEGREIEKIGSTGRALAHVKMSIRDDGGNELPAGEEGEICLRGPKITSGCWRDLQKTAASFHGDWFRTGDVGYVDEDGFLFITDRKKDMIIPGGENIASSEVERVIFQLPQVSEAAVVGVPDPKWGEKPVAVLVLRKDTDLDYPTLEKHCREKLAAFKVPKILVLKDSLPRSPSGKVLKRVLCDEVANQAAHDLARG